MSKLISAIEISNHIKPFPFDIHKAAKAAAKAQLKADNKWWIEWIEKQKVLLQPREGYTTIIIPNSVLQELKQQVEASLDKEMGKH